MVLRKFELKEQLKRNLGVFGFKELFPIQEQAIPLALKGRDILGQAKTGTGKTLAFAIPIVNKLDEKSLEVQALVLTPTRELAQQVNKEFKKITLNTGLKSLCVYGGVSINRQISLLDKGVQIVVGTPGRILDHLERKTLRIGKLKVLVLDEADRMLDMGFIDDVERIMRRTPEKKQVMLFSATLSEGIIRLSRKHMHDPKRIQVSGDVLTVENTEQFYVDAYSRREKFDVLCNLLNQRSIKQAIIFSRTKRWADHLSRQMKSLDFNAQPIHGDLSQAMRNRVMTRFKEGKIKFLIATDVAARGLDIPEVSHVVNYDPPDTKEDYVHRVGRTGRAGAKGEAITILTREDYFPFRKIHNDLGVKIRELRVRMDKRFSKLAKSSGKVLARRGRGGKEKREFKPDFKRHRKKRDKRERKMVRSGRF